jgi:predicted  nucleic acid-binding Zn-ribbon protein
MTWNDFMLLMGVIAALGAAITVAVGIIRIIIFLSRLPTRMDSIENSLNDIKEKDNKIQEALENNYEQIEELKRDKRYLQGQLSYFTQMAPQDSNKIDKSV